MILFFCGAPKHGSNFQLLLVIEILKMLGINYKETDGAILHKRDLKKCSKALDEYDQDPTNIYVVKGHFGSVKLRDFLLKYKTVKIFLIWRDLRDVLVSQYFSDRNLASKDIGSFDKYYWRIGRFKIKYHLQYIRNWNEVSGSSKVFVSSYERLFHDFSSEVESLMAFLGLQNQHIDIATLKNEVSINRFREKYNDSNGKFFRKGISGDYENIIPNYILNDIEEVKQNLEKSFIDKFKYEIEIFKLYPVKRWIVRGYVFSWIKTALRYLQLISYFISVLVVINLKRDIAGQFLS